MNKKTLFRQGVACTLFLSLLWLPQPRLGRSAPAFLPMEFYRSLAEAIDSVDGHVTIELNKTSNRWRTTVSGTPDLEWKYAPSATPPDSHPVMDVFFRFRNGFLDGGPDNNYVEFTPEIVLSRIPVMAQAQVVKRIHFDNNGNPTLYEGSGTVDSVVKSWGVSQHIKVGITPDTLFLKGPFAWTSNAVEAGGTGPFLKKMSLTLSAADQARGGIELTLRDDADVILSRSGSTFANTVTVAQPSRFKLSALTNDLAAERVDGKMSSLAFTLHSGQFSSNGLNLLFDEGSRLSFKTVEFQDSNAAAAWSFKGTDGRLSGNVLLGTRLVFSTGPREMFVVGDKGSGMTLDSLKLEFSNQVSSVDVGGESKIDLNVANSRFPLVNTNYVTCNKGRLVADTFAGSWRQTTAPAVSGTFGQFQCEIKSGVFSLVSQKDINVIGGTMIGSGLVINGSSTPVITGNFSDVTFNVEDGATLEIPTRFLAVSRASTRLIANDPNAPFSIRAGLTTVAGNFRGVIPFWTCFMPPDGNPVIRDSMLRSTFVLDGHGSITGTDEVVDYTCCPK